jgi:conjugative relaxase-like TrwC/TraI family protein
VLTITKLRGAEYLLRAVAGGVEDYYMGAGEAPGVWHGRWAEGLGLAGVVEADELRALIEGEHPTLGAPMLAGHRERTVKAYDLTMSAPKSVSLLWAFGDPSTSADVSIAVSAATTTALDFLERHVAVTRRQVDGIRRQVATEGFAIAMFTHRTSRAGDPQLHIHSLVPNVVERIDGERVAIDGSPLHTWLKAAGSIFQSELQRELVGRLDVTWGPERNGCRELEGFDRKQLRAFSERTVAIETLLEAGPEVVTAKDRMKADDLASLKTRDRKDRNLTPETLRTRWAEEATRAGIQTGPRLVRQIQRAESSARLVDRDELMAALTDPEIGLCATRARFNHAHVIERVAAFSGGRWSATEIEDLAEELLASRLVVRLTPSHDDAGRRRPAEWSTVEHRQVEDRVLTDLATLRQRRGPNAAAPAINAGLEDRSLGEDQRTAVELLCGPGPSLRVVLAPAGHGKTALTVAAASIVEGDGRSVVALATTNKAVAELRTAGLDASTIARWRLDGAQVAPGAVVVLDEVSQVSTRDAHALCAAVVATPFATLWCLGDDGQGRSVAPGGLAAELARLADAREVAAASLTTNRRQRDPIEREALVAYRSGHLADSQAIRRGAGWEHDAATPATCRRDLAVAAVADIHRLGPTEVAVLAVSHVEAEDLADHMRDQMRISGRIHGAEVAGPAWGPGERRYATGDRVLLHANLHVDGVKVHNGSTGTVVAATGAGLGVAFDTGSPVRLPIEFVGGSRPDGSPNLSHAWARTIDGAQGGTWEQVHLLAGASIDRNTLYVGQSRGRRATHTWNSPAGVDVEAHGNVVRDERTPDEVVLAAASRMPENRFAAADDPYVLDRQLRAERAEHEAALAGGPRDLRRYAARVSDRVARLEGTIRDLGLGIDRLEPELARTSGIRKLRSENRIRNETLRIQREAMTGRLDRATTELADARRDLARLEEPLAERGRWEAENRWHHHEIARIDHQLGRHWSRAVVAVVQQGEPLAFGRDRLDQAQTFLAAHGGRDEAPALAEVRAATREVDATRALAERQADRGLGLSL